MPQTRPWLHLRGPSGQASEVPLQDGLIAGRGALGVRCAKKISRQHIMFTLAPDGLSWRVELRGINGAELRRTPDGPPIAIQREPVFRDVRLGDTISLAARHPEHTLEIVAAGAPATALQLARAAAAGHRTAVAAIVAEGAVDLNYADPQQHGRTALHLGCLRGHTAVARVLLDAKADPRRRDDSGDSPLHLAAWRGHGGTSRVLARAVGRKAMDVTDHGGDTPLHLACLGGHVEAARVLLKCGASVLAKDRKEDNAVAVACGRGHAKVVRLLLDTVKPRMRRRAMTARNRYGLAPIHVAALRAHAAAATALLHHAPLSVLAPPPKPQARRKKQRMVPLLLALHSPRLVDTDIVRLLLDSGGTAPNRALPLPLGPLRLAAGQPCAICGRHSHSRGDTNLGSTQLCRQLAAMLRISHKFPLIAAQQRLKFVWVALRVGVVKVPSTNARLRLEALGIDPTLAVCSLRPVRLCLDLVRLVIGRIGMLSTTPRTAVACRVATEQPVRALCLEAGELDCDAEDGSGEEALDSARRGTVRPRSDSDLDDGYETTSESRTDSGSLLARDGGRAGPKRQRSGGFASDAQEDVTDGTPMLM